MTWIGNLDALSDEVLERCLHADLDDDFDWRSLVNKLRICRTIARDLDDTPAEEVTDNARAQAQQTLSQLLPTVEQIEAFNYVKETDPHNTRARLSGVVDGSYNAFREHRIHAQPKLPNADELRDMRAVLPELRSTADAIRETGAEVTALKDTAEGIISRLTEGAAQAASGQLSRHYADQVRKHEGRAKQWLIASGVAGALVLVVGLVLFLTIDVKGVKGVEFARDAIARLVALSILSYALTICTRGYRSQTHLAIVCQQKANALDTFVLFQETAATPEGKEAVTIELVRTVFAISDSGYLDSSGDKTIVEQQSGALSTLLATRR